MSNSLSSQYYIRPAVARVRSLLQRTGLAPGKNLDDLNEQDIEELLERGVADDMKLHHFKRKSLLPRVKKVLGILRALMPENMLDVGTGRGVFLWPLLEEFQDLPVHCVDMLDNRIEYLLSVADGGIDNLSASKMDVTALDFPDNQFDIVTLLETLEHIPDSRATVSEVVRVAKRGVIVSVPSKPDNNPEHIHLFNQADIEKLFAAAGVSKLKFDWVLNHMVVLALK